MTTIWKRTATAVVAIGALAACNSTSTSPQTAGRTSTTEVGASTPTGEANGTTGTRGSHPTTTSTSKRPPGGVDPNAPEVNSLGDIPDTATYVPYTPPSSLYTVKFPEGWSRTGNADVVSFTDKFNAIQVDVVRGTTQPTIESVRDVEMRSVATRASNLTGLSVTKVTRKSGDAILAVYEIDSAANPVTGKSIRVAVERYEFFRRGNVVVLTLLGAVGADNVDPWNIVTNSFSWAQ